MFNAHIQLNQQLEGHLEVHNGLLVLLKAIGRGQHPENVQGRLLVRLQQSVIRTFSLLSIIVLRGPRGKPGKTRQRLQHLAQGQLAGTRTDAIPQGLQLHR